MSYRDCGRILLLTDGERVLPTRVGCHRKTCDDCQPAWRARVRANICSACPTYVYISFIRRVSRTTVQKRLRRAGQQYVCIPLASGTDAYLTWPGQGSPGSDVEETIDGLLEQHDYSQRISASAGLGIGRRVKPRLRSHGYAQRTSIEEAAKWAIECGLYVTWIGTDQFEVRGTPDQLREYMESV